jgi:O-antigen/teichoic acid export membrane protein
VWALAIAGPISMLVMLLLDYILFALRHRLSFDRKVMSEVYHFGKWIFLSTTLTYLSSQGDKLFLSFTLDPTEFGLYAIALSLISFMLTIIQNLSNQLWLPYFSENKLNHAMLKVKYYKVRLIQDALVLIGIVLGLYLIPPLISTLYDERYTEVSSLLILLLPLAISASINEISKVLLITVGETKVQMTSVTVRTVLLIMLLPTMFSIWGLSGVILATIISSFLAFIPQALHLYKTKLLNPAFEAISLLFVILIILMILEKV